jgi:CCR4-NOT transcriptional regulation complex NOT5 subunit
MQELMLMKPKELIEMIDLEELFKADLKVHQVQIKSMHLQEVIEQKKVLLRNHQLIPVTVEV